MQISWWLRVPKWSLSGWLSDAKCQQEKSIAYLKGNWLWNGSWSTIRKPWVCKPGSPGVKCIDNQIMLGIGKAMRKLSRTDTPDIVGEPLREFFLIPSLVGNTASREATCFGVPIGWPLGGSNILVTPERFPHPFGNGGAFPMIISIKCGLSMMLCHWFCGCLQCLHDSSPQDFCPTVNVSMVSVEPPSSFGVPLFTNNHHSGT